VNYAEIVVLAAVVLGYALVSKRLATWSVSGPLVFVVAGVILGPSVLDIVGGDFNSGGVELLAEATLVLILFVDATRIDLRVLRRQLAIPVRLLAISLPLTIITGTVVGAVILFDLTVIEAAILAAVLAPTDAALGQAVVSNKRVPVRIRQALNVESGLNDGLMLPVITILTAIAVAESSFEPTGALGEFVLRQIGFGVLLGLAIGAAGGAALDYFVSRGWVDGALRQIGTLAIAVGAYAAAGILDGNGFVAAFIAGLAFGYVAKGHCDTAADFTEDQGQLLALLTFLFFGALLVGPRLGDLTVEIAAYGLLSLTVIRMAPVAVSLIGMRLEAPTVGYLAWFGPRGLASILFGVFVVEQAGLPGSETIATVVTWTVLASIVLHGMTAVPFSRWYGNWWESMTTDEIASMPEGEQVHEMRTRLKTDD